MFVDIVMNMAPAALLAKRAGSHDAVIAIVKIVYGGDLELWARAAKADSCKKSSGADPITIGAPDLGHLN